MYLHCKAGFFEVDQWNGDPVPAPGHQAKIDHLAAKGSGVVVVRARSRRELRDLLRSYAPTTRRTFVSPPGWDYPYRAYMTTREWGRVMARVGEDLDYRNFKSWTQADAPHQHELAYRIWRAAYESVAPEQAR